MHGHPASRPLPAFPHHHRRGEQQLHQCRSHGRKHIYLPSEVNGRFFSWSSNWEMTKCSLGLLRRICLALWGVVFLKTETIFSAKCISDSIYIFLSMQTFLVSQKLLVLTYWYMNHVHLLSEHLHFNLLAREQETALRSLWQ